MIFHDFAAKNYALADTLSSGQAFRWREVNGAWEGVIDANWIRLSQSKSGIRAEVLQPVADWRWLSDYLQNEVDLDSVISSFPEDPHMAKAVESSRGLRLLRQDPWECLASFILSSTKQIVQIQQIVDLVCSRFGQSLRVPDGHPPAFSFPSAERIASLTESELRCCKMGFRAPYLKGSAEMIVSGEVKLADLFANNIEEARAELMKLPGVGRKIADCVLLFAYGFQQAFPIDVWILKALQQLYFPKRKQSPKKMTEFTESYFGPNAGYAQQYLFHYMRTRIGRASK